MPSRRDLIKLGLYGGTAGMMHLTGLDSGVLSWALDEVHAKDRDRDDDDDRDNRRRGRRRKSGGPPTPGGITGEPFTQSLPNPAVKRPVNPNTLPNVPRIPGATYYDVTMRQSTRQILPGAPTIVWGYDGTFLGPTFVANIGETVVVRQHNNLPVDTIVHHHGAHVAGSSDGSALLDQIIPPGTFRDYVYPNDDDVAATHWYHDHDLDDTGPHAFMGLAGVFLLHDATENGLLLPGNPTDPVIPGQLPFDFVMCVQDRAFDAGNQFAYNPFNHDGFVGDKFLVNGAIQPGVPVANRKYRIRFLNGSNARFYSLSLSNGMPIHVIGTDGGLLPNAVAVDTLELGPAERYEVILDFSSLTPGPNTQVFLNNRLAQTKGTGPDGLVPNFVSQPNIGTDGVGSIACFDVLFSAQDPSLFTPGQVLRTDLPVYNANESVRTRLWEFQRSQGAWQINGQFYDPTRIDAFVKLNTTEIWTLKNGGGGWYHPVHIHRNQFRILSRNGGPPGPLEHGLKDVFVLEGGDTVDVITKYTGANALGDYVMHCHNMEHEDMRMMIRWNVSL